MKTEKKQKVKVVKQKFSWQLMWKQRYLLLMSVPFVIWLIILNMSAVGWTMAFQGGKAKQLCTSGMAEKICGV